MLLDTQPAPHGGGFSFSLPRGGRAVMVCAAPLRQRSMAGALPVEAHPACNVTGAQTEGRPVVFRSYRKAPCVEQEALRPPCWGSSPVGGTGAFEGRAMCVGAHPCVDVHPGAVVYTATARGKEHALASNNGCATACRSPSCTRGARPPDVSAPSWCPRSSQRATASS